MMHRMIYENERGLVFRNGRLEDVLMPGRYMNRTGRVYWVISLSDEIDAAELERQSAAYGASVSIEKLLKTKALAEMVEVVRLEESGFAAHFVDGRFAGYLFPGVHAFWKAEGAHEFKQFDRSSVGPIEGVPAQLLNRMRNDPALSGQIESIELGDAEIAAHFVNGRFDRFLSAGVHMFWRDAGEHSFRVFDRSNPAPVEDMPPQLWSRLNASLYQRVNVAEYQKARMFRNDRLEAVLEPGVYYYWLFGAQIRAELVDMRLKQMTIIGQELLTQDKVAVRVSFVISYRISDPVRSMTEVGDFAEQLHVAGQLALREFVAQYKMDEMLDAREQMTDYVLKRLREQAERLYVEVFDAGVKDITLPGNIRDIMNTVLVAEKRAQANVIARREEVASTRSLLNTAKLMDDNKTLYRLKELEALERIVEKVGSITLNGSGDLLSQLSGVLRGER